jgi:biopolymer transport protein ExbD
MSAARKIMDEKAEMDMTPMIDIVFNLLIFFMVVSDLTQKDLANLTLPLAYMAQEDKDDDPDDRVILNVDDQGQLLYKSKPINLDELKTILENQKKYYNARKAAEGGSGYEELPGGGKASKLYVLLRADKNTPWQHVQWLMTIMAEAKLYKLQFATKKFLGGSGKVYSPEEAKALDGLSQKEYQARFGESGG